VEDTLFDAVTYLNQHTNTHTQKKKLLKETKQNSDQNLFKS
jgi:hypothetical protein